jgi:hypothetical protein
MWVGGISRFRVHVLLPPDTQATSLTLGNNAEVGPDDNLKKSILLARLLLFEN